jgi:hypothetical protein
MELEMETLLSSALENSERYVPQGVPTIDPLKRMAAPPGPPFLFQLGVRLFFFHAAIKGKKKLIADIS